jgi:hypothetical protein
MLSQRNGHSALQIHTWNDLFSGASTAKIRTKNSGVRKTENTATTAKKPRSLTPAKKARTLLHEEAELLDGVLGVGPHLPREEAIPSTDYAGPARSRRREARWKIQSAVGGRPPEGVSVPCSLAPLCFHGLPSVRWSRRRPRLRVPVYDCLLGLRCRREARHAVQVQFTMLHFFTPARKWKYSFFFYNNI